MNPPKNLTLAFNSYGKPNKTYIKIRMSKSALLISQVAIQDLESIWNQARETSSVNDANALYTLLITKLRSIAYNFTIGKSIENTRDGYRFLSVRGYSIYYRADLVGTVEVVRVLGEV